MNSGKPAGLIRSKTRVTRGFNEARAMNSGKRMERKELIAGLHRLQ